MRKPHNEQEVAASYRKAYDSGKKAIRKGWERLSPYVGDKWLDWWFCVGWDGLPINQAWDEFRKANERRSLNG